MIPTAAQCRAARTLLNVTRAELARRSGVSERAIAMYENGETKKMLRLNHEAIRQTFEQAGIIFIGKSGVQLRGI